MSSRRAGGFVGVVTDSTACLPADLGGLGRERLRVVPLSVTISDATYVEGEDVTSEDVAAAHAAGERVITSRPSPARVLAAYRELADAGCGAVVSLHASSTLSSTVSSARLAAVESPVPVDVIDSGTLGMALGFGAWTALRWSHSGADVVACAEAARGVVSSSHTAFYVDSLEPLRRGGRIGRAGALFGSALSIKPLLHVKDGAIEPLARVRSSVKAMERLGTWGRTHRDAMELDTRVCAVHSLERSDLAERVTRSLSQVPVSSAPEARSDASGSDASDSSEAHSETVDEAVAAVDVPLWSAPIVQAKLGAVVTAHVGAGTVAVAVAAMPAPPD